MTKKPMSVLPSGYDYKTSDARACAALIHRTAVACHGEFGLETPAPILAWLESVRDGKTEIRGALYNSARVAYDTWVKCVLHGRQRLARFHIHEAIAVVWSWRPAGFEARQLQDDYLGGRVVKSCGNAIATGAHGREWIGNAMEMHALREAVREHWLEYLDKYGGNAIRVRLKKLVHECAAEPADGQLRTYGEIQLAHVPPQLCGDPEYLLISYRDKTFRSDLAVHSGNYYWQEAVEVTGYF